MGGGHHHSPEAMPRADQDLELLKKHRIPIALRDNCAHLLIKVSLCIFVFFHLDRFLILLQLDECRRETLFNPDRCGHQRHTYEECQFIAWTARVDAKKKMMAEAKAQAELELKSK
jgi:NADH dehydrogenase (ubiquinone) 1 beta subcomplex subunit 7